MSTPAMVGYALADGTWRAVWNHWGGHTQHLGRFLMRQVAKLHGDLPAVCATLVDGCAEGWSSLAEGKRCEEPVGFLHGQFDGVIARCDAATLAHDCPYLYLFFLPKRRLYVFEVREGPMRPFGMVTFDAEGAATPKKLPPVEE